MEDRGDDRIGTYSGGMKRRLNIAVGLLHEPRLVFMDEPTVGIDPQSRRAILDSVMALNQSGLTVLYTTHYMEEAQELSDRVGIIDHGELIAEGTAESLIGTHGGRDKVHLSCDGASLEILSTACLELTNVHDVHQHEGSLELTTDDWPAVLSASIPSP